MKTLVCCLLLSLISLGHAVEDLPWTPVEIPGLEIVGDGTRHLGLWFHGDFGWLNAGTGIWMTHDAGRSWTLSLTAPAPRRVFYDAYFLNAQDGWAAWGLLPHLFQTSNGGATWRPIEAKIIQTSDTPVNPASLILSRLYFKDSQQGLGIFTIDRAPIRTDSIVARTADGGRQWTEIARGGPFPQLAGFGNHVRIDGSYTPDFGETFQRISTPSELIPFFASPLYGWSIDYSYVGEGPPFRLRWDVLKTTNGGHTWSAPIFSRTAESRSGIWNICLISEEIGTILWHSHSGDALSLHVTYDGGLSWFSYNTPFKQSQVGFVYTSCHRERKEVWLLPMSPDFTGGGPLFYTSLETITAVQPSRKRLSTWGTMKKIRKGD